MSGHHQHHHHHRVSLSFLASYEKNGGDISQLCRACLCRTDDEYISIGSTMPWSQGESCTARKMVEQILNKELSNVQPQPQRICSICIKKIKAISMFRHQCIESDNILSEYQKYLENQPPDIESKHLHNDLLFDMDEIMFPEQMEGKFLPVFDTEILKIESNMLDEIKRDLYEETIVSPPTPRPSQLTHLPPPRPSQAHAITLQPILLQLRQVQVPQPLRPLPPIIRTTMTPNTPAPTPPPEPPTKVVSTILKLPDNVKTNDDGKRVSKGKTAAVASTPAPVSAPVTRKRSKKVAVNSNGVVHKHVGRPPLRREDAKISTKTPSKKHKKEKLEEDFTGLCEQCGLTFTSSNEYKKHVQKYHADKDKQTFKFHCKFCSKGFNHRQTYNIHVNSHTREQTFTCDMCGKELATKNSLRIHFRYHLGIKNHICPKCAHRFVTPRELRDHVEKKHATVRAIACTYSDCSETFDSEYRLNLHIRVHETNYAFKCEVCGVATVSKFRLGIHKKIHTGEMKRNCPICQKRLAHDNALRRHIKNVHGDKNKARTGTVSKPRRTITLDGIILTHP